jgi:hypothetical protein
MNMRSVVGPMTLICVPLHVYMREHGGMILTCLWTYLTFVYKTEQNHKISRELPL